MRKKSKRRRSPVSQEDVDYCYALIEYTANLESNPARPFRKPYPKPIEELTHGEMQIYLNRLEYAYSITDFVKLKLRNVDMWSLPLRDKPIEQLNIEAWNSQGIRIMRKAFNNIMQALQRKKRL